MTLPVISSVFRERAQAAGLSLEVGGAGLIDELEPLWLAMFDHHRSVMDADLPVVERSQTWPRRRRHYADLLARDGAFVLLARRDAAPVGYVLVYLLPGYDDTWESGATIAEIESLAVVGSERGSGVGSLLLDVVDDHLAAIGVRDIRLGVIAGNDRAMSFYRRRGLVPTLTVMRRHDPV